MLWIAALALPVLFFTVWLSSLTLLRAPPIRDKIITLLIAHPDDEAMFFSPALLSLTPPPLKNTVRVLCLSSGDADGLGAIRKGELVASCRQLGLHRDSDVTVIEHASLPDSMTTTWPAGLIAELLGTHAGDADVILTFDGEGVSSHPNHISLLHGAREYVKGMKEGGRPRLYTLTSVGLARKYISMLDAPMTFLQARRGKEEDALLFVNTAEQTRVAQKTMTTAHKSQMRWFRWGWIALSRYMVVNDLKLEKLD